MKIQVFRGLLYRILHTLFTLLSNKSFGHSLQNPRQEVELPMTEGTTLFTWVQSSKGA